MNQIKVFLSDELKEKIKDLAKKEGKTMSAYIRECLIEKTK